ncbi:glycosyltransferase [Novosphingobium rosa]|uniref:glycosyltransferase n=1 Tax=Novosphingobium rosa TaxID=76978 RepID=UPI00082E6ED4|nr:glycosyltransferase [Novosphingobium rosa]
MRLLFDLQGIQNLSRGRGIGRYVLNLFQAIAARDDVEVFALLNGSLTANLDDARDLARAAVGDANILIFPGMTDTMPHNEPMKQRRRLCEAAYEAFVESAGCDALLVGSLFEGFDDQTVVSLKSHSSNVVKSAVLYDLIPLIEKEKYLGFHLAHDWYFDRVEHLVEADLLLAISGSSRQEGIQHLGVAPDACINVGTATDRNVFYPDVPATRKELAALNIVKPFLMHTSAFDERKNFEGLIEAFALLPKSLQSQYQLVLVGGSNEDAVMRIRHHAAKHGLGDQDVIFPGYVTDSDLAKLYRSCSLFVFPSFHEGFGLPALEAMSCGCPAIGSNLTSIPEVIGSKDLLFDPHDASNMASLIEKILTDSACRDSAVRHAETHSRTFSWEGVADRVVNALKKAFAERPARRRAFPDAERMLSNIASAIDLSGYAAADLLDLTSVLVEGEQRIAESYGKKAVGKGAVWRIEGPFDSTYSLALLNRETARALANLGYDVALKSTEGPGDFDPSEAFLIENPDLKIMHDRAQRSTHEDAVVVSRNLYPPRVEDLSGSVNALHHFAWEEAGFPVEWVDNFNNNLNMMTCLSKHVEKIMIDNGVSVPMVTSGCGVDHWERIEADPGYKVDGKAFKFLHVSSCFPRKGVDSLIEAYGRAFSCDDDVSLIIKTFENPHNDLLERLAQAKASNSRFPNVITIFGDISDRQLKALYAQCDVMVGPSHAEGYGLPFAEAMLSGIPVITTAWGGQTDFCNEGNSWLVDYKFERPDTHFNLWFSAWAKVDGDALVAALKEAYASSSAQRKAMATLGRDHLLQSHKWSDVAGRLSAAASLLPSSLNKADPCIGWISTWNERCGIATYSKHLIDAMDGDVVVFGPKNFEKVDDGDQAVRVWHRGKDDTRLGDILSTKEAERIDVFVIQFNNTFFNHTDLGNFVEKARALGKPVVICLHATRDQVETQPEKDYHLSYMVPTLAVCDRVLVHSVEDLNRLKKLGLVHNVALFPHGALVHEVNKSSRADDDLPLIATYGFALPHKGLSQVVEAVKLLKDRNQPVRLRLVNSEHPASVSGDLLKNLYDLCQVLGLGDQVEFHNHFLKDEDSLDLLSEANLVVFAYQNTAESASGAVRYGMTANQPVAVTPIPIFDDLQNSVYRFSGTSPEAIADGIERILASIENRDDEYKLVSERASSWRKEHDYRRVAKRLRNICKALI